jgi:hypothetical protein
MLKLRHVPLVLRAIGRWVLTSKTGRRFGLGVVGVAGIVVAASSVSGGGEASATKGTWTGFGNSYAPDRGTIVFERAWSGATKCEVRGRAGYTSGNGWVFKGDLSIRETSCEGDTSWTGKVSAPLAMRLEWNGSVKGIGGDWDSVSGKADCSGELRGRLGGGGEWEGTCRRQEDGREWPASFTWTGS